MVNQSVKPTTVVSSMLRSQFCLAGEGISADAAYLFNTLLLRLRGVLVMVMAAGFAMPEAGAVRSKSVAVILAIAGFTFTMSYLCWLGLRHAIGIRLHDRHKTEGGNIAEIGLRAYNL